MPFSSGVGKGVAKPDPRVYEFAVCRRKPWVIKVMGEAAVVSDFVQPMHSILELELVTLDDNLYGPGSTAQADNIDLTRWQILDSLCLEIKVSPGVAIYKIGVCSPSSSSSWRAIASRCPSLN